MNIKTPVATAIIVASFGAVSACASSAVTSGAAGPGTETASVQTSATTSAPATSAPDTSTSVTSSTSGGSISSGTQHTVKVDIPDSALLVDADLAAVPTGTLKAYDDSKVVAAAHGYDFDHCDPVSVPQFDDPNYPRNPAWVNTRSKRWMQGNAQVSEAVITYKSASDARADFTKHQSWVANCAAHFQWTDAPQKFAVSKAALTSVSDAYAIHVGFYGEGQPASSAGSQGYDYMAVILRGNSLTVLDVSQTAIEGPKSQDPGPTGMQHDVQAAAAKLAAVYGSSS